MKKQRQLLVECSDPGLVISLAEEFENVLRHIDFAGAKALQQQLGELARQLSPEVEQAWAGFRLETSNDGGGNPPSFGNREDIDKAQVERLVTEAAARGLGKLEVHDTMLLPQDGPEPETREQYISDLASTISSAAWAQLAIHQRPVPLPAAMSDHRGKLVAEHLGDFLRGQSHRSEVGHVWVREAVKSLEKLLEEVDQRAEAVMLYELERLDPSQIPVADRLPWAALAIRLDRSVEKWYAAAEQPLEYVYQRVALAELLWTESQGCRSSRQLLEARFQLYLGEAEKIYTSDGQAAIRSLYDHLRKPIWDKSWI